MINYIGAATSEKQAQNAMKKYAKYTTPDPNAPATEVVWNSATSMLSGCKIITGYQNKVVLGPDGITNITIRVPIYHASYWMSLLSVQPDDLLFADVAKVGAPIMELDYTRSGTKPSAFVRRSANMVLLVDTQILGITPLWLGAPDMHFIGDVS